MRICVIKRIIRRHSIRMIVCRQRRSVNPDDGGVRGDWACPSLAGPPSDLNLSLFAGTWTTLALMPD